MGGRKGLLPSGGRALHPSSPFRGRQGRSRVSYQTADSPGTGRAGCEDGYPIPGSGRGHPLWGASQVQGRTREQGDTLRFGLEALPRLVASGRRGRLGGGVALASYWGGAEDPGEWVKLERHFRDGHAELWWALESECRAFGPEKRRRLVVATTDPATLPSLTSWYLVTNLPAPGSKRAEHSDLEEADLAEVVRLYALRNWIEQSYKQVKNSLGWAHYQVRKDIAMRRHWQLVCCAFAFCWWESSDLLEDETSPGVVLQEKTAKKTATPAAETQEAGEGGEKERRSTQGSMPLVAARTAEGKGMAGTIRNAHALLEGVLGSAPASGAKGAA